MKGLKLLNMRLIHPITIPGVPGTRSSIHAKQVKSMEFISTSMVQIICTNNTVCYVPVTNIGVCISDDQPEA